MRRLTTLLSVVCVICVVRSCGSSPSRGPVPNPPGDSVESSASPAVVAVTDGELTVTVLAEGVPLESATVEAVRSDGRVHRTTTDSRGIGTVLARVGGRVEVRVAHPTWGHRDRSVVLEGAREELTVEFEPASTVDVEVALEPGQLLSDVWIMRGDEKLAHESFLLDGTPRPSRATFEGLPPGQFEIFASGSLGSSLGRAVVRIETNGERKSVSLELRDYGDPAPEALTTVTGVVTVDRQPASSVEVTVTLLLASGVSTTTGARTDDAGAFVLEVPRFIEAGAILEVGLSDSPWLGTVACEYSPSVAVKFSSEGSSGRELVIVGEADVPLADCRVTLTAGRRRYERTTDGRGVCVIDGFRDGEYRVTVGAPSVDRGFSPTTWTTTLVLDGPRHELTVPWVVWCFECGPSLDGEFNIALYVEGGTDSVASLGSTTWPKSVVGKADSARMTGLAFEYREFDLKESLARYMGQGGARAVRPSLNPAKSSRPRFAVRVVPESQPGFFRLEREVPRRASRVYCESEQGRPLDDVTLVLDPRFIGPHRTLDWGLAAAAWISIEDSPGWFEYSEFEGLPETLWLVSGSSGQTRATQSALGSNGRFTLTPDRCLRVQVRPDDRYFRFEVECSSGAKIRVGLGADTGELLVPILIDAEPVAIVVRPTDGPERRVAIEDGRAVLISDEVKESGSRLK